ncbi:MAG: enoyl-CoA hydratase-related protein, partial [Arenimonas sp.]
MFDGLRLVNWKFESRSDGFLILTLDRAGETVNSLSREVIDELDAMVERIALEPPKGVIIRSGKSAGFIAGADIKGFEQLEAKGLVDDWIRRGQRVYQSLAQLRCPTVAMIHGHCMGGGTELALACRYRVASNDPSTRIGLPEVKLGIYPAWGGSVRLPRLVGAPAAFDMMLTQRNLSAPAARGIGLVDRVVEPAMLLEAAIGLLQRGAARPLRQRMLAWITNTWLARQILAPQMLKQVSRKARKEHYPAPFALVSTWQRSGGLPIAAALNAEATSVVKLAQTPTARNLVRVF